MSAKGFINIHFKESQNKSVIRCKILINVEFIRRRNKQLKKQQALNECLDTE